MLRRGVFFPMQFLMSLVRVVGCVVFLVFGPCIKTMSRMRPFSGLAVFFPPVFYLNLSQRNAIGVMVSRTKSECCTPNSFHAFIDWNEKNKEKSGVKNRIDLNIPHIIVKMRNQGHVSCSGNIVVCVNLLYNHLMPPVFTVKVDLLEYKCTILFPFC